MLLGRFAMAAAVLLPLAGGLQAAEKAPAAKKGMTLSEKISKTRIVAAANPVPVLKDWMTAGARRKWSETFGLLASAPGGVSMLSDFFSSAVIMGGPRNDASGILAFYNPLQDTVMLVQTDNSENFPRIENFSFMTGTRFRGETLKKGAYPAAIVPTGDGVDAVLMRNTAAVFRKFQAEFPATAKEPSLGKYGVLPAEALTEVTANASLRMALLKKFVAPAAAKDLELAAEIMLKLWNGKTPELKDFFVLPEDGGVQLERIAALPRDIRTTLLPVLYLKNKKETLFGFSSRILPEIIVLIRVENSGSGRPFMAMVNVDGKFCADMFPAGK
ncbi:MAG: hypothetical protein IJU70_07740 [Lentisphaeria bacterium]|nr:hypothetical protein [Lentisphaeria bacterium]